MNWSLRNYTPCCTSTIFCWLQEIKQRESCKLAPRNSSGNNICALYELGHSRSLAYQTVLIILNFRAAKDDSIYNCIFGLFRIPCEVWFYLVYSPDAYSKLQWLASWDVILMYLKPTVKEGFACRVTLQIGMHRKNSYANIIILILERSKAKLHPHGERTSVLLVHALFWIKFGKDLRKGDVLSRHTNNSNSRYEYRDINHNLSGNVNNCI